MAIWDLTPSLGGKLGDIITLTVANVNGCDYCNSAHSFVAGKIGIQDADIAHAVKGYSAYAKINAALTFSKEILNGLGAVYEQA